MQRSAKILTLALAASLAVHLLLVLEIPEIGPPQSEPVNPPLQATLTRAPPPAVATPVKTKTPVTRKKAAPSFSSKPASREVVPEQTNAMQNPVLTTTEVAPKIIQPVQEPAPPPSAPAPAVTATLPAKADLVFTGYKGDQEDKVAEATLTWRADADTYLSTLRLNAYAFYEFVLLSRGRLTPQGLQPQEATTRHRLWPLRPKTTRTQFDWVNKTATLSGETQNVFSLPEGAQDQLSALHQLFFSPATGDNVDIVIVSNRKTDTHHYQANAETLATPLGNLKTVHYREQRSGDASFEFWLASEYQNLPVKIDFSIDGTPYHFLISKISIEQ